MNTNNSAKLHYVRAVLLFAAMAAAIPVVDLFSTHPTYATDPPPSCQNLTVAQSEDKDYYNLAVTASAAKASDISGYQFDFGDNQSYTFNFDAHSTKDRRQANVKHTYQKAGQYIVTAKVLGKNSAQTTAQTTAPECTVTITIAGASTELPATGNDFTTTLTVAGMIGLAVYLITLKTTQK